MLFTRARSKGSGAAPSGAPGRSVRRIDPVAVGGEVELVEHPRLPRRHRRRRGRGEVGDREEVEIAQPLATAHEAAELLDRRRRRRGRAASPRGTSRGAGGRAGAPRRRPRRRGRGAAGCASQSSAPLCEWFFREPLASGYPLPTSWSSVARKSGAGAQSRRRGGEASGYSCASSPRASGAQAVDRGDRVNVDRVHVVDVVVDAPGHREKLRHHRQEQPDVVQLASDRAARASGVSATWQTSSTKRSAASSGSAQRARTTRGRRRRARWRRARRGAAARPAARTRRRRGARAPGPRELLRPGDGDLPVEEAHAAAEVRSSAGRAARRRGGWPARGAARAPA